MLVDAISGALREDFAENQDTLDRLESLAELPNEREEFLRLKGTGLLANGDYVAAAEALLELSAPETNFLGVQTLDTSAQIEMPNGRTAHRDGWIRAQVDEIVRLANDETLAKINEMLANKLQSLSSVIGPQGQQLQRHFGHFEACDSVLLAIAHRFRVEGSMLMAERLLRGAAASATSDVRRDRWLATLAALYLQAQWHGDALAAYRQIKSPDELNVQDPWTLDQLKQLTRLDQAAPETDHSLDAWPAHVHVQAIDFPSTETYVTPMVLNTMQQETEEFSNWKLLVEESTDMLQMRTPHGNFGPIYRLEGGAGGRNGPEEVYIDHGMMVVVLPSAVIGFDLFEAEQNPIDMEVWRRQWRTNNGRSEIRTTRSPNAFGQMINQYLSGAYLPALRTSTIINGQFIMLQSRTLSSVDVLTGKDRWRMSVGVDDGFIAADDSTVSVISPSTRQVHRYRISDGEPLRTDPWLNPSEKIWAIYGAHVLSYHEVAGEQGGERKLSLRLWDATTGKDLISADALAAGTKGEVVENRYVITLQPKGDLNIWDMKTGRALESSRLDFSSELLNVHGLVWGDRLIVMPNVKFPPDEALRLSRNGAKSSNTSKSADR
ncbi:MAG: hypothetical protein R3C05_25365 [Pirellulaceae bacterium]